MRTAMAEDILNDSFPDLKELEIKTGRKIPESLLVWMRDASDCEDGCGSDVVDKEEHNSAFSNNLCNKIVNLRQEMRWLRSVDVKILRQLVAVHEGIEAMRWLMEERGTLTSRGSSLTGSLSSLVTEEHGPSMSPCRESPSLTYFEDLTEIDGEESLNRRLPDINYELKQHSFSSKSQPREGRPPSPTRSTHRSPDETLSGPGYSITKSSPEDLITSPLKVTRDGDNIVRNALLRSSRVRKELKVDTVKLNQKSGEVRTVLPQTEKNTDTVEEEDDVNIKDKFLFGYDTQWCWVESQDDVTFV